MKGKRVPKPWLSAALGAASLLLAVTTAVQAGVVIQPHKATYVMELASTDSNSTVVHARGRFDYEWSDACDAWAVTQRALLEVAHNDGSVFDFAWTYSAWEEKAGQRYRFIITRRYGNSETEEIRGEAQLAADGSGGLARYTLPDAREVPLPSGTIFPSAHSIELLERLAKGQAPIWRTLFDGSGENDGLYGVSVAVAGELPGSAATEGTLFEGHRSWNLLMAFFPMDDLEALPEQEQTLRIYENGVTDSLTFDYGDFSVKAVIDALEALPEAGC